MKTGRCRERLWLSAAKAIFANRVLSGNTYFPNLISVLSPQFHHVCRWRGRGFPATPKAILTLGGCPTVDLRSDPT